jgi:hypothetical protein
MKHKLLPVVVGAIFLAFTAAFAQYPSNSVVQYTSDAQLKLPENYREWVYLSTGYDMSYAPGMQMGHHMFDNVFVNPDAYKKFVETGTWPDKTMFVLEVRGAVDKGSINQKGSYQSTSPVSGPSSVSTMGTPAR